MKAKGTRSLHDVVDALIACGEHEVGKVLKEHKVTVGEFWDLDNHPGTWGYRDGEGGWHWKLRRFRNTNKDGSILIGG